MEFNDQLFNELVLSAQNAETREKRNELIEEILEQLKPLRFATAKKFGNKGVEFSDIAQHTDLKLIEAIYDYDQSKDPSALRHLTSRVKNGVWNFYRKEMNYFKKDKETVSLDQVWGIIKEYANEADSSYYDIITREKFDEDKILERIVVENELNKLTPHQREVLLMLFVDDMTQYDIAELLNINQSNVSRAKRRGINSIKEGISPSDEQIDSL